MIWMISLSAYLSPSASYSSCVLAKFACAKPGHWCSNISENFIELLSSRLISVGKISGAALFSGISSSSRLYKCSVILDISGQTRWTKNRWGLAIRRTTRTCSSESSAEMSVWWPQWNTYDMMYAANEVGEGWLVILNKRRLFSAVDVIKHNRNSPSNKGIVPTLKTRPLRIFLMRPLVFRR